MKPADAWPQGPAKQRSVHQRQLQFHHGTTCGAVGNAQAAAVTHGNRFGNGQAHTQAIGFGGEESAGASFLRKDGGVWSTDKDGLIPALLAAEMTARTGRDPSQAYKALTDELGEPFSVRVDAKANPEQKALLSKLSPDQVTSTQLAGEAIQSILSHAPGNDQAIGGLKVMTENGWFAARPSGTESIYKIYMESFKGEAHLDLIQQEAQQIVSAALAKAGV